MKITFDGNPVTVKGQTAEVGKKAPAFQAVKNDLSDFNSEDLKGKIRLFSVVPSIDTGVCAKQTKKFNEMATDLGDDVHVITISMDLPFAQERFGSTEGIERAELVSDYKYREFGEKYGFYMEDMGLLTRGIVVVDRDDQISYVEYVEEVTNEPDYEKALEAVKAAQ